MATASRFKGLVGNTNSLPNWNYDSQRSINRYPEFNETGLGKDSEFAQLVPTPGLTTLLTVDTPGQSRNGYTTSNNALYWTFGNTLYKITGYSGTSVGWTSTFVGNIPGTGDVQYSDNGLQLFCVCSTGATYIADLVSNAFWLAGSQSGDGDGWLPASSVTYMDGYVVFTKMNSNEFFWTDLYSTQVEALNFASAETNPDHVVKVLSNNEDLWVFGGTTTELWYDLGSGNTVFERRQGILVETGAASPMTIEKLNNTVFWLAVDDRGGPIVYMANGYSPVRVSTFAIENILQSCTSDQIAQATADSNQWNGHYFYTLNIPGLTSTYVFDMTSYNQSGKASWFEKQSGYGQAANRSIAEGHAYYMGKHITGDYLSTGQLYFFDQNSYTENGLAIARIRTTPHVSNSMKRVKYISLQIDYQAGTISDQYQPPQVGVTGVYGSEPLAEAAITADMAAIQLEWPNASIQGQTIVYGANSEFSKTYTTEVS